MTLVNIIAFIFALVLFVGGFWVMGAAFEVPELQSLGFLAGLTCTLLALVIPVHVLKRIDG